ncbi:hypothetical protein FACS189485_11660 [Spirochaetia bacterium]|nr:hypothetical protein FACS189485_11660 [Spirochaetia bacterium]
MIKINLKLSGIAAAAGFILSLLVGITSRGGFPISLLRALLCGAVFFGLSYGIWVMINRFLPELLISPSAAGEDGLLSGESAGSRIDISVDDGDETVLDPGEVSLDASDEGVRPDEGGAENDLGNISDLMPGDGAPFAGSVPGSESAALENANPEGPDAGMDQNNKESYTKSGSDSLPGKGASVDFVPTPLSLESSGLGDGKGLESLPDLDVMAEAFMSSEDADEEDAAAVFPVERKPPDTKGKSVEGKLNSRELASAIQSILKKD